MGDSDPTNDQFSVMVFVATSGGTGSWTADDASSTTGNYDTSTSFGPYLVSGGDVTITFTDNLDPSCSEQITIMAPTDCDFVCPTYNVCYEMISSDECTATYVVDFDGDFTGYTLSNYFFTFNVANGVLESANLINPFGPVGTGGVFVTPGPSDFTISGGSNISGSSANGLQVTFTVSAEPDKCVSISRSTGGIWFDGNPCMAMGDPKCDPSEDNYCATGTEIGGQVSALGSDGLAINCSGSSGGSNNVEGAELTITSASGDSCNAITSDEGKYACKLCGKGPFTVCVDTECPESCGITAADVALLTRLILGFDQFTVYSQFMGDINQDGRVSASDRVNLNKEANGQPNNIDNWCRFLPAEDLVHLGQQGPQNEVVDDACRTLGGNDTSQDFVRFMLGDMDNSCDDCTHGDGMGDLPLVINDDDVGIFTVRLTESMGIFYGSIELDIPDDMIISDISSSLDHLQYNRNGRKLRVYWMDESGDIEVLKYSRNSVLLTIKYSNISSTSNIILVDGDNVILDGKGTISKLMESQGGFKKVILDGGNSLDFHSNSELAKGVLVDFSGRIIWSETISISNDITDIQLMNKDIPTGIYIFNISNESLNESLRIFIQ